ncbi:FAD-dependent oxidoreductase [Planktomarina temperata]|nr:FAD-dependent oxidoreductase [Planktomarina temperata]MDC1094183.1 FAD-dependent oxidoreductase [Planktomarina temperata]
MIYQFQCIKPDDFDLPSPETFWLKGNYFKLNQASPFTHLIYPLPQAGGLGIHLTIDLDGRARFGPDTEETCVEDYSVDFARMKKFEAAIKRYWPYLPENSLSPDYSGIRPKIKSLSINNTDFEIHGPDKTGIAGLTVLHGIESSGLTASLSIAASIHQTLLD